ncbi:MAG: DNA (cytosine-5-)-methyltransferase [Gammaproteobacteria bacterium]|nr:DNA (cytosine-5-)-methyltransferase [Gammaproteobacteria bacterium]
MPDFTQLRRAAGLTKEEAAIQTGYTLRTIRRWEKGETSPRKKAVDRLISIARSRAEMGKRFRFIDLFAGIGGLRRGFDAIGGECVFTSEWNHFCQETYLANYSCNHDVVGDITKINVEDIPEHEVLLAGFPCQPFSIAGVTKKNALNMPHGFRCTSQGTLFFDVARILEHHRPHMFLLENVKNLVGHDQGRTFDIIYKTLTEELGYSVSWKIIDARPFVPQHRERIFIVGSRGETGFSFDDLDIPNAQDGPRLDSILHPEDGSEEPESHYTVGKKGKVDPRYTLSDHLWQYLQRYAERHRRKGNGFGYGLFGPQDVARTLSARYYKDGAEILIRQTRKNPRRLTPRECARLMGFDKPRGRKFRIPVSDTQAYRQFGNAVAVPVVEAIAQHMKPWILETHREYQKVA